MNLVFQTPPPPKKGGGEGGGGGTDRLGESEEALGNDDVSAERVKSLEECFPLGLQILELFEDASKINTHACAAVEKVFCLAAQFQQLCVLLLEGIGRGGERGWRVRGLKGRGRIRRRKIEERRILFESFLRE